MVAPILSRQHDLIRPRSFIDVVAVQFLVRGFAVVLPPARHQHRPMDRLIGVSLVWHATRKTGAWSGVVALATAPVLDQRYLLQVLHVERWRKMAPNGSADRRRPILVLFKKGLGLDRAVGRPGRNAIRICSSQRNCRSWVGLKRPAAVRWPRQWHQFGALPAVDATAPPLYPHSPLRLSNSDFLLTD